MRRMSGIFHCYSYLRTYVKSVNKARIGKLKSQAYWNMYNKNVIFNYAEHIKCVVYILAIHSISKNMKECPSKPEGNGMATDTVRC